MFGWLESFCERYGMGGSDLELSTLVAPVPVPEKNRRRRLKAAGKGRKS